jgi:DNA-binding response OmpR family regulator
MINWPSLRGRQNRNSVFSVWGPEYGQELEYLRTFIRQLRSKIEDVPQNPHYLLTEAYVGYRFNELRQEP